MVINTIEIDLDVTHEFEVKLDEMVKMRDRVSRVDDTDDYDADYYDTIIAIEECRTELDEMVEEYEEMLLTYFEHKGNFDLVSTIENWNRE